MSLKKHFKGFALLILLGSFGLWAQPGMAQYLTYSGSSVGSNGTVYGYGVTNATNPSYTHDAYAATTITSPTGRRASSGTRIDLNTVRADVYLTWDGVEVGQFLISTRHDAFCFFMGWFIYNVLTRDFTTVPRVTLSLRNSGTVLPDNGGRGQYIYFEGQDTLGTFFGHGADPHAWRTGVEVVGTVLPINFTRPIKIRREITESRVYVNNGPNPYEPPIVNQPDTTPDWTGMRDDDPQSGGSGGKVYDLDAPFIGSGPDNPIGLVWRKRVNFRQWATTVVGTSELNVAASLYWYSRLSIVKTMGGDQLKTQTDIPGDNQARPGATRLTWNLQ